MFSKAQKRRVMKELGIKSMVEAEKYLIENKVLASKAKKSINETVHKAVSNRYADIRAEVINDVTANAMLLQLWLMYDKYGFKNKRLQKHLAYILDIWELITDKTSFYGKLDTATISSLFITELGFDVVQEIQKYGEENEKKSALIKEIYPSFPPITDKFLTVSEATEVAMQGKKVRRSCWKNRYLYREGNYLLDNQGSVYVFNYLDLTTSDWEIVREEKADVKE